MDNERKQIKNTQPKTRVARSKITHNTLSHFPRNNVEIAQLNADALILKMKCLGLDTEGNDDIQRTRLKNHNEKRKLAHVNVNIADKLKPFYVIIDFEATCSDNRNFQQEIIEFPAVLVNSSTQEIVDTFQMYCKPKINPKLTDYCINLTGITQEQVDSGESFSHVLGCFNNWLSSCGLDKKYKFCIVTDSPWDMSKFLYLQCHYEGIPYPAWGKKWINLKSAFMHFYKCEKVNLKHMLDYLEMEFEGRWHCGLDDAKNIARVLIRMIQDGANIYPNERICSRRSYPRKSLKEHDPSSDPVGNELQKKTENLRIQPAFAVIRNWNRLSTYKTVKRQREKLEAKMNGELKKAIR